MKFSSHNISGNWFVFCRSSAGRCENAFSRKQTKPCNEPLGVSRKYRKCSKVQICLLYKTGEKITRLARTVSLKMLNFYTRITLLINLYKVMSLKKFATFRIIFGDYYNVQRCFSRGTKLYFEMKIVWASLHPCRFGDGVLGIWFKIQTDEKRKEKTTRKQKYTHIHTR